MDEGREFEVVFGHGRDDLETPGVGQAVLVRSNDVVGGVLALAVRSGWTYGWVRISGSKGADGVYRIGVDIDSRHKTFLMEVEDG